MNWIERQISKFAPAWGLKRHIAKRRLNFLMQEQKRSFEAVGGGRFRHDFLTESRSVDSSSRSSAESLRHHVRHLEQNNGFISGPILRDVNNVVGSGIRFQARVKADTSNSPLFPKITNEDVIRFNFLAERAFRIWTKQADIRLIQNFWEIQRTVRGALRRDGESLVIIRNSNKFKTRLISTCLEVLEIDRLQTPTEEITNPRIKNGIEFDDEGCPKIYFIRKQHPGESIKFIPQANDFEEILAFNQNGTRKVLHLFNIIRPEQTRGYSDFAAALKNLQDLDRYAEAEIMAALEDACLVGIIKTPSGGAAELFQANQTVDDIDADTGTRKIHEFAPGATFYLDPGQDMDVHRPVRPNRELGEFMNQLLRGPANALDIPPEILTQNWQGMNYSNARTILLQWYLSCRIHQQQLVTHLCEHVWASVAREMVAMGIIQAPFFDRRIEDWLSAAWIPPGWAWVDPLKEAQGKKVELANNIETLPRIWAAKGEDWEEQLEMQARVLKKMIELEEQYGVTFPKPNENKIGRDIRPFEVVK